MKKITDIPWKLIVAISIVFLLFFINNSYILDPDFGWHLQGGEYILVHGIPSHDVFTYTASDFEWINHEWLSDVITAVLFNIGGFSLLAIVFSMIWTGAILLASRFYNWLVLIATAVSILSFSFIRPSAWSVLLFTLLERIFESKHKKLLWFIPLIMLAWCNLHGSFILGLCVIFYYKIFKKSSIPWEIILLSIAVTIINPYGFRLYIEIFRTLFDQGGLAHTHISEWGRFKIPLLYFVTIIPLLPIFLATRKINFSFKKIASLPAILFVLSLSAIRGYIYVTFSIVKYLETGIADFKNSSGFKLRAWQTAYILFVIGLASTLIGLNNAISFTEKNPLPDKAIAYIQESGSCTRIFNAYDYGGYLIWKLPSHKVYMDGRIPLWEKDGNHYFKNYLDIVSNKDFRNTEFKKYSIDCVLFYSKSEIFVPGLKQDGWTAVVEERGSVLLIGPK